MSEGTPTTEAGRGLRELLPGLDSLLVLDAASAGSVLASRPDVWDILRAFLDHGVAVAEQQAAAAERARLESEGWHAPLPDCGPIKAAPHVHSFIWSSTGSADTIPTGVACECGYRYSPEPAP